MQILFLGTGPTEAIPRKGHTDALCREARSGGKNRRMRSSTLVSDGKFDVLIDSGPDILKQLKRFKIKKIDAILLTHGHEDAVGGLRDLDLWLQRFAPLAPPFTPVYTDHLTAERLTTRFGRFNNLRFCEIKDYSPIVIPATCPTKPRRSGTGRKDDIRIVPFPVLHTHDERYKTYGYKFDSFCYASDFYDLPKRTKNLLKNLSTLILDGAMYLGVKMPTHMSADATVRLASDLRAQNLILTQCGHTYPPHEQAEKTIRAYIQANLFEFPKTVRLAFDGLKLKFPL